MSQEFYVIRELNRNMILGLDWMNSNNVRIYMDLKCIRIKGKHYVNLQEDIHVASTVRMKNTCLIKPQTAIICHGKVRENPDLPTGQSYDIEQINKEFLINQPGLQIMNTVVTLMKNRTLQILVVNIIIPHVNSPYKTSIGERLIFYNITHCYSNGEYCHVFAIAAGDIIKYQGGHMMHNADARTVHSCQETFKSNGGHEA